ncbi:MAG TPA: hypothetical protein VNW54_11660 [Granulicella sp.]|jgi:hypothetical protein|nr:hypothetical protein [Granulicella sp.]
MTQAVSVRRHGDIFQARLFSKHAMRILQLSLDEEFPGVERVEWL